MTIKYKVSEVAKDLNKPAKQIIDLLAARGGEPKKVGSNLEEGELNYIFEHFTRETEEKSLDAYLDSAPKPKPKESEILKKADGTVGTGMFNGDVGRIVEIDPSGELLVVNFDDRIATYTLDMLNEIDLAYAMTVHKAQGSEYQCVVLAAMPAAPSLMVRGVLYTALTRARELLIVVGDDAAIRAMAANDRQQRRYSGLRWRLAHFADPAER